MTGARTKPDQLNGSGPITSNDPSITGTYNFPVPPRSPTHTNLRFHDVQGSPPSPTAKLDELIASEAFYYADDAPAPLHVGRLRQLDQTSQPPKSPLLAPSNKPLTRSASTRVPMAPSSFSSSSASRAAATASAASQRNPSIDSAISSMSSVASGQNRKASDSTPARAMDVTNLIVQAGSPELAIQKLLDDKKALKDDSDKMWRLIEKQRAMILGLNKDLEKTVKEKDKYRRRLKEQLAIIETLSQSKSKNSLASSNQPVALPEIVPEVLKARSVQEPAPEESTPTKRSQDSVRKSPGGQQVDGQSNPLFPMSQQSPKGFSSRRGPTTPPDPSLPEAKGSATKPASTSQSRKAAPQSLPLSQNLPPHLKPTSTISPKQAVQDSGSDYEDEQGIAQLREYERDRGRRKTREEDDYDREVAFQKAQAESQGRSRSSKTAKATSKVAALSVVQDEAAMQQPLPSGRAFRAIQPPSVHEESEQTRGIGSILEQTPPLSRDDSATRTTMALPPKVAGLPLSPRPLHRPQNAPAPRLPRADIEPYSPPPTASLTFQGLPSSPRPGHRMVIQPSAPVRSESADSHTSDERLIASGAVSETNKPKRQPNELAMDFSKAGPLLKKGRNFGGWTKRFFSIDGQTLRYFEALGGAHLGSIRIHGAQLSIGATANDDETVDQTYSFQLLEPKRKDSASHIKHVLGAESQAERDSWMEVLSYLAELDDLDDPSGRKGSDSGPARLIKSIAQQAKNQMQQTTRQDPRDTTLSTSSLKSVAYNETAQQPLPITGVPHEHRHSDTPSPSTSAGTSVGSTILNSHSGSVPISAPTNGAVITNAAIWGNKVDDQKDKQKRRHLFNFRGRHSPELLPPTVSDTQSSTPVSADRPAGRRPVFGAPLIEAAHFASPPGIDVCLPAIVYRCIEYLHAKNASKEEGIFRISGSSTTIKGLEQRFDREGDVNLLDPNIECDIHVVASLFKTYLRKLPSTVLTRDLHSDFVQAIEIDDRSVKVATLHTLVRQLPEANWTLIREVSAYLITVIEDSDVNKMTIRNVGIVFAPTINIPAAIFTLFLTEFDDIFGANDQYEGDGRMGGGSKARKGSNQLPGPSMEDLRSPRNQAFQDLSTPGPDRQTFAGLPAGPSAHRLGSRSQHTDTGSGPFAAEYEPLPGTPGLPPSSPKNTNIMSFSGLPSNPRAGQQAQRQHVESEEGPPTSPKNTGQMSFPGLPTNPRAGKRAQEMPSTPGLPPKSPKNTGMMQFLNDHESIPPTPGFPPKSPKNTGVMAFPDTSNAVPPTPGFPPKSPKNSNMMAFPGNMYPVPPTPGLPPKFPKNTNVMSFLGGSADVPPTPGYPPKSPKNTSIMSFPGGSGDVPPTPGLPPKSPKNTTMMQFSAGSGEIPPTPSFMPTSPRLGSGGPTFAPDVPPTPGMQPKSPKNSNIMSFPSHSSSQHGSPETPPTPQFPQPGTPRLGGQQSAFQGLPSNPRATKQQQQPPQQQQQPIISAVEEYQAMFSPSHAQFEQPQGDQNLLGAGLSVKAKRRESSMLGMGLAGKSSYGNLRD